MDQWLGNLFGRGQSIEVLERAAFHALAYWNDWHKLMAEREAKDVGT
jgi:hypothetical protein